MFGDVEAAAVDILQADPAVAAFAPGVSTDYVGMADRWVRVARNGGSPIRWLNLDAATVDLDITAEDKATAHDLASAVVNALLAAVGTYQGHGLSLFDADDTKGFTWAPDTNRPDLARYTASMTMITRPI